MPVSDLKPRIGPDEFVSLTLEHEGQLFSFVASLLPGCRDVEDIVQEVVMTMWKKSDQFERGTNFGAWACRIARFKVLEHIRSRQHREVGLSEAAIEAVADDMERAWEEMAMRAAALRQCIERLDGEDRKLVLDRFRPKATLKAIAQQIGKSEVTVRKWLRKILFQLERCINNSLDLEASS